MNLPIRHTLLVALGLASSLPAIAQQVPVTGRMMDGQMSVSAPVAPQTGDPATPPPVPRQLAPSGGTDNDGGNPATPPALADVGDDGGVGHTTRELLRMQASGSQAGKPLPMLGDEATAAYRRYMQSFNHPIPEFFQSTVSKNGSGSGNGGGP